MKDRQIINRTSDTLGRSYVPLRFRFGEGRNKIDNRTNSSPTTTIGKTLLKGGVVLAFVGAVTDYGLGGTVGGVFRSTGRGADVALNGVSGDDGVINATQEGVKGFQDGSGLNGSGLREGIADVIRPDATTPPTAATGEIAPAASNVAPAAGRLVITVAGINLDCAGRKTVIADAGETYTYALGQESPALAVSGNATGWTVRGGGSNESPVFAEMGITGVPQPDGSTQLQNAPVGCTIQ